MIMTQECMSMTFFEKKLLCIENIVAKFLCSSNIDGVFSKIQLSIIEWLISKYFYVKVELIYYK